MRGIPIARFGGKFNSSKAKVFMLLIPETHKGHWLRPRQVHDTLGIPLGSLLVLMAKWSGPDWRKLQRRKKDGFFEYQSTLQRRKMVLRLATVHAHKQIQGRNPTMAGEAKADKQRIA